MSVITETWRQLVRRRLWPVALLLVAALAAVPFVLAKEPIQAPPATVPVNAEPAKASALDSDPIVSLAVADRREPGRRVLGDPKDPFKPTKKTPKAAKADATPGETAGSTSAPTAQAPPASAGAGSGTPSGPTTPSTPTTPDGGDGDTAKPTTIPAGSLLLRFAAGGESEKGYLRKLSALPSADEPLILYTGLTSDGKKAIFLIDTTVVAQGDGECAPTPENCETVELAVGETEFFDLADKEGKPTGEGFQLDLLKIVKAKTSVKAAGAARASRAVSGAQRGGLGRAKRSSLPDLLTRTG